MGRKATLSRERIQRVALEWVDEHGLSRLSMRKLGDALGVEGMAIYRYFPNKDALLEGIFEQTLAELELPPRTGDWRADIEAIALAFRAVLARHPQVLPLFAMRPATSPASLDLVERGYAILQAAGLEAPQSLALYQSVFSFVSGFSMLQYAPVLEGKRHQVAYDQLDATRYPQLSQLGEAVRGYDPEAAFRQGLQAILQGFRAQHDALQPTTSSH